MSSVFYEGNKVNSSVLELKAVGGRFPGVSSRIQSLSSSMVSCKGFNYIGSGVTTTTFSGEIINCNNELNNLITNIRNMQTTILAYSNEEKDIEEFLDSLDKNEFKNIDLTGIKSYIGVGRKLSNGFKSLAATLFTAGAGFVEGVAEFVETGADLVTLAGSAAASIFTGTYDLITGSDTTKQMWEETRAKVSEKVVENAFNDFYNETEFGREIKENAYHFDTVRGISSGIGYTTSIIALNVVTGGLASGLGVGAAGSVGVGQLAATAGVMGFSSGTENAWADGATTGKGLLYGAATGAWEATQWAVGAKINQYGGLGDQIASGIFKGGRSGAVTRVVLDSVDSGLEGFVQPGLTMIYKDYEGNSLTEKYKTAFNENGGWTAVRNQAIMGGIMSAGSEFLDARKILKSSKNSSADVDGDNSVARAAGVDSGSEYRLEMASDDILQREIMEDQMAAAGDFSRHSRSTIDGDYIRTADTEFNSVTSRSGKAPDNSIKFMDGSYVPSGQKAGSLLSTETYYDGATFNNLLEQRRSNLSGYDYTQYKDAAEIFASHGKTFNMTELKLIINHSEGNVSRIKSAIAMSESTLMPQDLDGIAKELSSKLFPTSSRNMGANVERGIANIIIDSRQASGVDNWKSSAVLFDDYYTYERALQNVQNSTPQTRLNKLNEIFGTGKISDDLAKKIVNSDGYPETVMKLLATDKNIPQYQLKQLSEIVSSKVFTADNAARVKAQYEVLRGNYDRAANLVSDSSSVFDSTAKLLRSSETFSQKAKRYVYYNSIDSAINFGSTKVDAVKNAKSMYAYAMDMVGTKSAKASAEQLFKSQSNFFGYKNNFLGQFDSTTLQHSSLSPYMKQYLTETYSLNRTQINADFSSMMDSKDILTDRPIYIRMSDVDDFKSLEAKNVFKDAYIAASVGGSPLESLRVMSKLLELEESGTSLYVYNNGGKSCSHRSFNTINLANQTIDAKNAGTIFHETGHYLFDKVLGEKIPADFENVRVGAVNNLHSSANSQLLKDLKTNISEVRYYADYKSTSSLKNNLANKGFSSIEAYKKHLTNLYSSESVSQRVDRLKTNTTTAGSMYTAGFDKEIATKFDFDDALNCANFEINSMKRKSMDAVSRSLSSYTDISGMIDSLTLSDDYLWYGHSKEYFARNPLRNSYHELIADYTSLRVRGETQAIGLLRQLFGTEVMDMLENTYQSMLK